MSVYERFNAEVCKLGEASLTLLYAKELAADEHPKLLRTITQIISSESQSPTKDSLMAYFFYREHGRYPTSRSDIGDAGLLIEPLVNLIRERVKADYERQSKTMELPFLVLPL